MCSSDLIRMVWLVKNMLKLTRVEAKVIEFNKKEVRVQDLVGRAVQPSLIPMELKDIELKIEGNEAITYIGDVDWSSEALVNIIKNCVEHTPQGGNINIFYEGNPLYTEIIIKDNGEGIDKKDLPPPYPSAHGLRSVPNTPDSAPNRCD